DELVEVLIGPGAALGLHGSGEIEAAALTLLVADDAIKIRADAVGTVLFKGVARLALLRRGLALFNGSRLQQLIDRLGWRRGFLGGTARRLFLHGNFETRLLRHHGRKDRTGGGARDEENKAGAENRAEGFIELEGVHFGSGSRPEKVELARGRGPR